MCDVNNHLQMFLTQCEYRICSQKGNIGNIGDIGKFFQYIEKLTISGIDR